MAGVAELLVTGQGPPPNCQFCHRPALALVSMASVALKPFGVFPDSSYKLP